MDEPSKTVLAVFARLALPSDSDMVRLNLSSDFSDLVITSLARYRILRRAISIDEHCCTFQKAVLTPEIAPAAFLFCEADVAEFGFVSRSRRICVNSGDGTIYER